MKKTLAVAVVAVLFGMLLMWRLKPSPAPEFPTTTLDSIRTVTETLRVQVRVRDTLWRTRVNYIFDSIPVVIASVDSAACRPVISLLTECAASLQEAKGVADDWKAVALRDSAQVVAERARADSILDAYPSRKIFAAFVTGDYDFQEGAYLGVEAEVNLSNRWAIFGNHRLPISGGESSSRIGVRLRAFAF